MKTILDQMEEHIAAIRNLQRNFDFHSKILEKLMISLNNWHVETRQGNDADGILYSDKKEWEGFRYALSLPTAGRRSVPYVFIITGGELTMMIKSCLTCKFHEIKPDGKEETSHCRRENCYSRYSKCVAEKAL